VAVLGTGKTRAALARRLAEAGSEMTVWNRTRSPAEEVGVGHVVATPADAVRAAEIVISSLTGPDALRATYGGPQGALSAASGQVFVQMSTAGPDVLAELEPQVVGTGSRLVDALSGCLRWCSAAQFALRALLNLPTRFPRANIRLVSYPQSSHRKST